MKLDLAKIYQASIITTIHKTDLKSEENFLIVFDKSGEKNRIFIDRENDHFIEITRSEYKNDNPNHVIMLKFKIMDYYDPNREIDLDKINKTKNIQLKFADSQPLSTNEIYIMNAETENGFFLYNNEKFSKSTSIIKI